jgi:hypothetical protein
MARPGCCDEILLIVLDANAIERVVDGPASKVKRSPEVLIIAAKEGVTTSIVELYCNAVTAITRTLRMQHRDSVGTLRKPNMDVTITEKGLLD